MPLAGGIVQHGYQCGMIWGAAIAAGAQAYRLFGKGPRAETMAVIAAQRLVASFQMRNPHDHADYVCGGGCSKIIEVLNHQMDNSTEVTL